MQWDNRTRTEVRVIWAVVVVVVVIVALGIYGYYTGAWEAQ